MQEFNSSFCLALGEAISSARNLTDLCNRIGQHMIQTFHHIRCQILIKRDQYHWKQVALIAPNEYQTSAEYFELNEQTFSLLKRFEQQQTTRIFEHGRFHYLIQLEGKFAYQYACILSSRFDLDIEESNLRLVTLILSGAFNSILCDELYETEKINFKHLHQEWTQEVLSNKGLLKQLHKLHKISLRLWHTRSLDNMLHTAVYECIHNLDIDRMGIFLCNDQSGLMRGTYGTDLNGNVTNEQWFCTAIEDHQQAKKTLDKGKHISINTNCALHHNNELVGYGWNATVSLWDGDDIIGWIACDNLITHTPLKSYHRELLKLLGITISQHLIQLRAQDELKALNASLEQRIIKRTQELEDANLRLAQMSREDSLTGIPNRRRFDEKFDEEWRRAKRTASSIGLLIIDIDHFKQFNDQYGHSTGDHCLYKIAQTLNQVEKRAGSLFARYGGEEFIYILPNCDTKMMTHIAKRAQLAIASLNIPHKYSPVSSQVTISLGGAFTTPEKNDNPQHFFNLADLALYKAKNTGKNKLVIHS